MFQFTVIGNLGGNAELHRENGNEFITFRVGHNERRTNSDGSTVDNTVWVSCILNGNGGNLLQYLVKGQRVCVIGDGSLRTYHSEKQRRLVAGSNLFVRSIELLGSRPDGVPSALFDQDGVQHNVGKYYYVPDFRAGYLYDRSGNAYTVDASGWVTPPASANADTEAQADNTDAAQPANQDYQDAAFDGQGYETVEQAQANKDADKPKKTSSKSQK